MSEIRVINGYTITRSTDLRGLNLRGADLTDLDLSGRDLTAANLTGANLTRTDLKKANLRAVKLRKAILKDTNLRYTVLNEANLSGAEGLINPMDYIKNNFELILTEEGVLVGFYAYKVFDKNGLERPKSWVLKEGVVIKEEVNYNRQDTCGCGINVACKGWEYFGTKDLWKVKITGLQMTTVVVPYNTDGRIRVGECELVEIVEKKNKKKDKILHIILIYILSKINFYLDYLTNK